MNYRDDVWDVVRAIAQNKENYKDQTTFFDMITSECAARNVPLDALLDILSVAYPPAVWKPWNEVVKHFRG